MTSNRVPRRKPSSKRTSPAREDGHGNAVSRFFDHFAAHVTKWAGSPVAFGAALIAVVAWGLSGPAFGYSETWQLVINTGTTIVTFLMVFLIQASQNRDSKALQIKLDELIRATRGAHNRLLDLEELEETELEALRARYEGLARRARECEPAADEDLGSPEVDDDAR